MRSGSRSYDIKIEAFGFHKVFPGFAPAGYAGLVVAPRPSFRPVIRYVVGDPGRPFIVVVGLSDLVRIHAGSRSIEVAFSMVRDRAVDPTMYTTIIRGLSDGFLLIHESGAVRFDGNGDVAWVRELSWDDRLIEVDDEFAVFGTEESGVCVVEFRLRLNDGNVCT